MNVVLAHFQEFLRVRAKKRAGDPAGELTAPQEIKRSLALVILRGETVVSLSVEVPPPVVDEEGQENRWGEFRFRVFESRGEQTRLFIERVVFPCTIR